MEGESRGVVLGEYFRVLRLGEKQNHDLGILEVAGIPVFRLLGYSPSGFQGLGFRGYCSK